MKTSAARKWAPVNGGASPRPKGGLDGAAARRISDYFGANVFGPRVMEEYLPKNVYRELQETIRRGKKLSPKIADAVAAAMKAWALSRGATHYSHWFQPLTGVTAEKHESFITPVEGGRVIEVFSGKQLIQAEPDASSFPSGGLRATFEARGYTAWDPSSPAFLMESAGATTLCIPTIFVSYTGDSLDTKTALLRSIEALNRSALGILRLFKNPAQRVYATLGAEQEYFLIDESFCRRRPDLLLCGRTLFGAPSPKGQQLEDHYFGSIRERIFAFMTDAESELYKLGVPVKTRHNEVAPNQFECAPVFEEANVAVDHNQLVMDVFRRVASRRGLALLLHEKPFAGINGSGKHLNWSLGTDKGQNLLSPGRTPQENLQFLVFLVSIIAAVAEHSRLLRASIASSGNDHRLGANEAPPAVISIFLGASLTRVLEDMERGVTTPGTDEEWMSFGIDHLPPVLRDNTDRNRTSPFAFTGDKFEFRAVGSSFNNAVPVMVLNAIMADALDAAKAAIEEKLRARKPLKEAVIDVLRRVYRESKFVCYEGNNYAAEWVREAKRRGLPNIQSTPEALDAWILPESLALFKDTGILSEAEARSRHHIQLEKYSKELEIEARLYIEMVHNFFIPAAIRYQNELIEALNGSAAVRAAGGPDPKALREVVERISTLIELALERAKTLKNGLKEASAIGDVKERAVIFCHQVKPLFEPIRDAVDALETLLPASLWPLPKYREMLFLV